MIINDKKIEQTIKAAAAKDYKKFEAGLADKMSDKMKEKLAGFMNYLETNMFKSDKED